MPKRSGTPPSVARHDHGPSESESGGGGGGLLVGEAGATYAKRSVAWRGIHQAPCRRRQLVGGGIC